MAYFQAELSDHEFYSRQFLPRENSVREMNHIATNNSIWTTNSPSLSDFEFSHFCRYFSFHLILTDIQELDVATNFTIFCFSS